MKFREGAVIEAVSGADIFLGQYKDRLAGVDPAEFEHAQQRVAEVLARLRAHAVEQDVGARRKIGETALQKQLRIEISEAWLRPIARIARSNVRKVPEYAALQSPKPAKGYAFALSARTFADAAAAHRDSLVAYGLPKSFLEDLKKAIERYGASLSERDHWQVQRVGATKGLESEASDARIVLAVLDANIGRWAKEDEELLRVWKSARHI